MELNSDLLREVLEDYLRVVPLLSISSDSFNIVLQKQVEELKEKSKANDYVIKAKLVEKDEIISSMKEKYDTDIALLNEAIMDIQQLLKDPTKLAEVSKITA